MPEAIPTDENQLAAYAAVLADALDAAIPGWVERIVAERVVQWQGHLPDVVSARAAEAGRRARDDVGPRLRRLLATDVDQQRTTPLTLVRGAVPHATEVLAAAGVPPVVRDEVAEGFFPADVYALVPATLADLDPGLAEAAITWGAAKAHVVLARRRAEGRR